MRIQIIGPDHCTQCDATERFLTKYGVPYEHLNLTEYTRCNELPPGVTCAPCVLVNGEYHHSGFRPYRLRKLIEEFNENTLDSRQGELDLTSA